MKNKKLTKKDKENIINRYNNAIECFSWYSLIELKDIFMSNRLSNTDKEAFKVIFNYKMQNNGKRTIY